MKRIARKVDAEVYNVIVEDAIGIAISQDDFYTAAVINAEIMNRENNPRGSMRQFLQNSLVRILDARDAGRADCRDYRAAIGDKRYHDARIILDRIYEYVWDGYARGFRHPIIIEQLEKLSEISRALALVDDNNGKEESE